MTLDEIKQKDPATLDELVDLLIDHIKKHEASERHVRVNGISHMGGGMALRNHLDLWWNDKNKRFDKDPTGKPKLIQWFNERDIFMGDDLSGIISEAVQAKLKGEEYDPTPRIERYKKHWKKYGFKDGIYNPLKRRK